MLHCLPGIYTFNDCKFWLLDNCGNAKDYEELLKQNALSEELYRLWKNSEECGFDVAEKLKDVSASVFAIICKYAPIHPLIFGAL